MSFNIPLNVDQNPGNNPARVLASAEAAFSAKRSESFVVNNMKYTEWLSAFRYNAADNDLTRIIGISTTTQGDVIKALLLRGQIRLADQRPLAAVKGRAPLLITRYL